MGPFGIGQAVKRFEDGRLVRGGGRFHDDVNLPGQVHAVVVRSIHAHARIRSLDISEALRAPGVLAVFTGEDFARAGLGATRTTLARTRPDGSPMFAPAHPVLVRDRVRCVASAVTRRRPRGWRDPGPGRGCRRARPDPLRAAALGDGHRRGLPAGRVRCLGRVP